LWSLTIIFTDLNTINTQVLTLFVFAGILAPAIARLFYFKAMQTAAISTNATIYATYPLYTTIIAVLLLNETLTPENWTGLLRIILGVIFVGKNLNNNQTTPNITPFLFFFYFFLLGLSSDFGFLSFSTYKYY
jgi:drug/metabolite transporter (DMT)-like permease